MRLFFLSFPNELNYLCNITEKTGDVFRFNWKPCWKSYVRSIVLVYVADICVKFYS